MSTLVKSNPVDKDLYCQKVYETHIFETSEFLATCEEIAELLRAYIPGGCYTNFRDALFHFRRMVLSSEKNEINKQAFAVKEHANRTKTDAIISILEQCSVILQIIEKKYADGLDRVIIKKLLSRKNTLDMHMLNFRLSGMMLEDAAVLRPSEEQFMEEVTKYFDFISESIGREKFHEALSIIDKERKK